ncbi:GRIP and coiled-coil domain-containing protein 2-like [Protopterus annectens]|uniref:GRIP and coiled-coil domain-containing protein 2-like n=1 Tax=Protopterus annectens TaxID=7888 RepID=UPI001CFBC90D|nr:GRIP and coiled-coil domain-containing protein 2-like [Protopterus annectens]
MADVSLNLRLLSLRNYYDKEGKIRHHSAAGGRRSPSWRETDSMQAQRRKSVGDSPPLSLADLNWNSNSLYRSKRSPILAEGILKSKPELLDSSYLYKDYREYDKGFTNLMQEPRARSASPLRALHHYELGSSLLTNGIYDYGKSTSPPIRRKHSMARILSGHQKNEQSTLASSLGGLTEKELRASLSESARKRAELINRLRTAHGMLEEQSELIRTRQSDLDINKTKIELLSLKQKQMEESVGRLEKEKEELELSRHEDIKQRGQLQDKISQLENEVAKTRSSLEKLTRSTFVPFATQRASFPKTEEDALKQGSDSLKRESQAVREALNIYKEHAENLVRERDKAVEELQSFKQEHHLLFTQTNEANQRATDSIRAQSELYDELVDLRGKYSEVSLEKDLLSSKVIRLEENVADLRMNLTAAISDKDRILQEKLGLNQQVQQLSLELERAQRGREGFNNQVSDLHIQLVSAKAQVNREDQEKILMKEELITVKQVNDNLTFELGQVCHKLENTMEQLHHLEAEKKILTNQVEALEMERAELLGEKEMLMSSVKIDIRSQEGESQALQEMCDELRASLETLEMENSTLKARNQELESQFRQREEQLSSMLEEHQRVAQHWKERWQESAVTLKLKEEELQQITLQFQNAQEKNTELLGDCALFQVELEELAELKTTVKRLHGERQHLMEKQKENGQDVHQLQLQRSITTGSPQHEEYLEKFSSERNICHGELQQNHDRINELGRQNTETEAELKKLKEENAAVLRVRVELDVCRQELELERSRSKSLQQQVHQLQMKCQAKLPRRLSRSRSMVVQFEHESPVSPLQERCFSSGDAIQLFEINSSESEGICDVIDSMPTERHTEGLEKQKLLLQIDALNEELVEMRCTRQKHEAIIQSLKEELEEVKLEKPNEIKASLEEVDSELFQVREELQKVWDMLKRRDTELEEQYLELESARDQFSECSTEKQRLASMVSSLEQQLSEKEQTLRHVERIHETEKTELEIKISSLELKLAEMEILGGKIKNETASQEKCFTPSSLLKRMDSTLKDEAKKTIKKQQEQNEALTSPSSSQEGVSERAHLEEWGRRSPYGENDNLKHQQRLVTEQVIHLSAF